jgi:hypothetical protein
VVSPLPPGVLGPGEAGTPGPHTHRESLTMAHLHRGLMIGRIVLVAPAPEKGFVGSAQSAERP